MDIDACFQLGHVIKVHGLHGEVTIFLDVDYPKEYEKLESVFVEVNNRLVPLFVETLRISKNRATVKFESVDSIEEAQQLLKCRLFLPLDRLPKLRNDQFYYHEITGFQVVDKHLGELGTVKCVYENQSQDLICMSYKECEVLIPVNNVIVLSIDRNHRVLLTSLPDGLVEIYVEN